MALTNVRKFPEDSIENKIYSLVESFSEYIPVANDRNRLAFSLFKYVNGEGDSPSILVKTTKITLKGISGEELAKKITPAVDALKS